MLASFDNNGNFISLFKKQIPEISEAYKKMFAEAEQSDDKLTFDWQQSAKQNGIAKKEIQDYFDSYAEGNRSLKTYTQYLQDQNKVLDLQVIKTKALNAVKNIGINLAFAAASTLAFKGIELFIKLVDSWIVTTKEAKEALSDATTQLEETKSEIESLNSELETVQSRIKELKSMDKLSLTEEQELEQLRLQNNELERELRIKQELAKAEQEEVNKKAKTYFSKGHSDEGYSDYDLIDKFQSDIARAKELQDIINSSSTQRILTKLSYGEPLDIGEQNIYSEALDANQELEKLKSELSKTYKDFTENDDDITDTVLLSDLDKAYDAMDRFLNEAQWTENKIEEILSGEQFAGVEEILTSMGKSGSLSVDKITQEFPDLVSALNNADISIVDFFQHIIAKSDEAAKASGTVSDSFQTIKKSFSQNISDLNDLEEHLDNLNIAIKTFTENGSFDLGDLDSIADDFLGLEDIDADIMNNVNEALKTLADTSATAEQQASAINTLADSYLDASKIMNTFTIGNKELMISKLKNMGISDAEEIVTARLNNVYGDLALAEQFLAKTGYELTEATAAEVVTFLNEAVTTDKAKTAIAALTLEKQLANGIQLSSSTDINNLISLCKMLGATTTALDTYNKTKNGANGMPSSVIEQYKKEAQKELQTAIETGTNALNDVYNNIPPADYNSSSAQNTLNDSASSTVETFNWLETLISRIERKITNLGNIVSSVWKNWSDRNHAIVQEMSAISEEIGVQQSAYDAYMAKADSVGLSPYYQALVQNGGFLMEDITNDTLKEQIKKYQEFYEKALACSDAVSNLRNNLADMAQSRFDNIAAQFNAQISIIEHETAMLNSRLDQIEAKGYIASGSYYTELIKLEQDNIAFLQNEYSSLMGSLHEALGNGTIEQYSEQWYDMVNSINDVQEAIENADSSLIDYRNSLRQLNWDIFDKTEEYISHIHSESDFLIELMNNRELYHENGAFNDLGNAAAGLHAVKYNTYMSQADDYAKEILTIDKEIADDPYNTTLMERRQELLELQQDSIKAAEDEKQSMKDLVSDGYDFMLTALQKLIDKRKDAMQSEKDLYDYQKSIAEQTMTIAQYQKQLSAFSGDDSEETQAAIQKIKVSLEEAKQNLAESEYDQWLTDQEKMLDSLYDETEEWVNQRLDNLNGIILEIIDNTNANADSIRETLAAVGENVGYALTPEMEKIWTASDGISQVVSQYGNNFSSYATTVQTVLSNIQNLILQMITTSDNTAAGDINGIKQNTAALTGSSSGTPSANSTGNSGFAASGFTGNSFWGSWFVNQKDSFDKSKLNAESSIVDRLKLRDISSDFQNRKKYYSAMGGTGTYTGSSSQNAWMIAQMKAHGFLKGGIIGNAIHSAGEDGFILARTGEGILPLEMMPEWEELISSLPKLNNMNHLLLDMPTLPHYNPAVNLAGNSGDVTLQIDGIKMYGVNNPEQFTESLVDALSNNTRIKKVLVDNTVGVSLGRNSLLSQSR